MPHKIELSSKSILFAFLLFVGFNVVYQIQDILFGLFISLMLVATLDPLVDRLERLNLNRPIAILVVYLFIIIFAGLLVAAATTPLIDQTRKLINSLPTSISKIDFLSSHQEEITTQLLGQLGSVPENLLRVVIGIFSNIFSVFTTFVITFYLLLEKKSLEIHMDHLFGQQASRLTKVVKDIEFSLGSWVRGELVLMFVIGLSTFIGLTLLGVDSALPLAIIAGVLEILPNIGPLISAIPAVLIAAAISPVIALGTVILYVIIQIAENNFLVPRVMQQAVGINPVIIVLCLTVGNRLAGPTGAVLAIPIFVVLRAVVHEVIHQHSTSKKQSV